MDTKPLSCKNDETPNICFPTPTCFLRYHTLELENYFRFETSAEPAELAYASILMISSIDLSAMPIDSSVVP